MPKFSQMLNKYLKAKRLFVFSFWYGLAWRLGAIVFTLSFLLYGANFTGYLRQAIKAEKEKLDLIAFYPQNFFNDETGGDYSQGWVNIEKMLAPADLGPLSLPADFSVYNSAYYAGGRYSLLLDNWQFLSEDFSFEFTEENKDRTTESAGEADHWPDELADSVSDDIVIDELEESIEVTDYETVQMAPLGLEEPAGQAIFSEYINSDNLEEDGEIGIEVLEETEEKEAPGPVNDSPPEQEGAPDQDSVEVVEPENRTGEVEIIPESAAIEQTTITAPSSGQETADPGEKLLKLLEVPDAGAQEFFSQVPDSLDDLGEFKKAVFKFSVAVRNKDFSGEGQSRTEEPDIPEDSGRMEAGEGNLDGGGEATPLDISDTSQSGSEEADINSPDSLGLPVVAPQSPLEEEGADEAAGDEALSWHRLLAKRAQAQEGPELWPDEKQEKFSIWYSIKPATGTQERVFKKLSGFNYDYYPNGIQPGYYELEFADLAGWGDIDGLQVKLEGGLPPDSQFVLYIDSFWLEVSYDRETELEKLKKRQRWEEALSMLSREFVFSAKESGELKFRYKKNEERIWDTLSEMMGLGNFWEDVGIDIWVENSEQERMDFPLTIIFEEDGEFSVKFPEHSNNLKPGKYFLKFAIMDNSGNETESFEYTQDFDWGVLAINSNKSIYQPGDEAYLQMAVLDDYGHTVCNADLELTISRPDGEEIVFTTADGSITRNPDCGPDNVIDEPDYYAYFTVDSIGDYPLILTASTSNGHKSIADGFKADSESAFEVERIGPTRIYPMADYTMTFNISAHEDYSGEMVEYVPQDFIIVDQSAIVWPASSTESVPWEEYYGTGTQALVFTEENLADLRKLSWSNLLLNPGDIVSISYTFDAPNRSPELYLLGPANIGNFSEFRQWQIASDVVESIWSGSNAGTGLTLTASTNANGPNTGTWASAVSAGNDWGGTADTWTFTMNNSVIATSTINSAYLYLKHYASGYLNDTFRLDIYDGSAWTPLMTWNSTTPPPAGDVVNNWNVSTILNTWTKIDAAQVRIIGAGKTGGNDVITWYVDTVELRVDYTNTAPTGSFVSAVQRLDFSGVVDISIRVDDKEDHNLSARIDYAAGANCNFGSPLDPMLDETDAVATSTYGDPKIENDYTYQVGNSSGWILTNSGANSVHFDWLSNYPANLNNQEGTYCLRLTAYDSYDPQVSPATTTLVVDNKAPSVPGNLAEWGTSTKDTIWLEFGATSTELNFYEYRIYYATSTQIDEDSYLLSSSTDNNLSDQDLYNAATTSVSGLLEDTTYFFSMWAYDTYGHVSSSTPIGIKTNKTPHSGFSSVVQRNDASGIVDISIEVGDDDHDLGYAKLEYEEGASCGFLSSGVPTLDAGSVSGDYGFPAIDNGVEYQIRDITTSPATNTLSFAWPSAVDLPDASSTYCLRLTAFDGADAQILSATTTFSLDNYAPGMPGNLTESETATSSITLAFGSASFDTSFEEYKIFYWPQLGGPLTEFSSSTDPGDPNLGLVNYGGAATTTIVGLDANTWYVFNIWAYDAFGNQASATAVSIKTDATVLNESLTFVNPIGLNNVVTGGGTAYQWNFRAVVTEINGWNVLDEVVLRLANSEDSVSPYSDLAFRWRQNTQAFSEIGTDLIGMVSLDGSSTSTCAVDSCTLDFVFNFTEDFATTSVEYDVELYSTNDSAQDAYNNYSDFYQVNDIYVEQRHYRWRFDNGGE